MLVSLRGKRVRGFEQNTSGISTPPMPEIGVQPLLGIAGTKERTWPSCAPNHGDLMFNKLSLTLEEDSRMAVSSTF